MKNRILFALLIIIGALVAMVTVLSFRLDRKDKLVGIYESNTESLLNEIEQGRVRDSLNTSKVVALELTVSELERFRSEDAQLIKDLKVAKRELAGVVKVQSQTIREIEGQLRDSVRFRVIDSLVVRYDSVKVVSYHDKYLDMGFILNEDGSFDGRVETRDKITMIEEVEYRRFLGFLWRTGKVKNASLTAVSDNPYTRVTGAEYIKIRR